LGDREQIFDGFATNPRSKIFVESHSLRLPGQQQLLNERRQIVERDAGGQLPSDFAFVSVAAANEDVAPPATDKAVFVSNVPPIDPRSDSERSQG